MTLASAIQIGNPVSYDRAVRALRRFDGVVGQASESELAEAAARADLTGLYTDPHTAVAMAVLEKLARDGTIEPDQRTVVISTATGLKFTDFKVRYHQEALADYGVTPQHPNRIVELPPDLDAVKREVFGHLEAWPQASDGAATAPPSEPLFQPLAGDRSSRL